VTNVKSYGRVLLAHEIKKRDGWHKEVRQHALLLGCSAYLPGAYPPQAGSLELAPSSVKGEGPSMRGAFERDLRTTPSCIRDRGGEKSAERVLEGRPREPMGGSCPSPVTVPKTAVSFRSEKPNRKRLMALILVSGRFWPGLSSKEMFFRWRAQTWGRIVSPGQSLQQRGRGWTLRCTTAGNSGGAAGCSRAALLLPGQN